MEGLYEDCTNCEVIDQPVLLAAAELGHDKCVKALLSTGADVNIEKQIGYTALMWAVKNEHEECVMY